MSFKQRLGMALQLLSNVARPAFVVIVSASICQTAVARTSYAEIDGGKIEQRLYDQYVEFNLELEAALNERDPSVFNQSIDVDAFIDNVLDGLKLSRSDKKKLRKDAKESIEGLGEVLLSKLGEEGSWKFLRLRKGRLGERNQITSLVRIDLGDNGLTYWEFYLTEVDGKVKIGDWYNYSVGQLMSEAVQHLSGMVYSQDRDVVRQLFGGQKLDKDQQEDVLHFVTLYREDKYRKALRVYHSLPEAIKTDPLIMVLRVEAASAVSERAYKRALVDLAEHHGQDPRFALLLVDYFFYLEDYAETHAVLDRFSDMIGGDAALESLHANVAYKAGDFEKAVEYCRKAISEDADYEDPYWTLLDLMVFREQYDEAVLVLKILQERFFYRIDASELAKIEEYSDFSRSTQFKQWAAATP